MLTRAELLQRLASDPAAGEGSSPYLLASCLTEKLKAAAAEALTATMAARLCPDLPSEHVYPSLMYLSAAAQLFEMRFSVRDEQGLRVAVDAANVRNHLSAGQPLVHPDTGLDIGMEEVEVTFAGTELLKGMLT